MEYDELYASEDQEILETPQGETEDISVQEGENSGDTPYETAPSKIIIDGKEYDESQVREALNKARDYSFLLPEFTRATQRLSELEKQRQVVPNTPVSMEEQELRKAVEVLSPYFSQMFMTKEEYQSQKELEELNNLLDELEEKYNGSDGRPKFNKVDILQYCVTHGNPDPEAAYKLIYEKELDEWKIKNAKKAPTPPPSISSTGIDREPKGKKRVFGNPENENEVDVRDAIEETLKSMGE